MHIWRSRNRARQDEVPLPTYPAASGVTLPTPVVAGSVQTTNKKKSARIGGSKLKVHWDTFKKKLGTGSALSESLLENGELEGAEPSGSESPAQADPLNPGEKVEGDPIDEIVVDNLLASDGDTHRSITDPGGGTGTGASPEKSGAHGSLQAAGTMSAESVGGFQAESSWAHFLRTTIRWRLYPNVRKFFFLHFYNDKMEAHFRREAWFTSKRLALYSSGFYVLNWIIGCVLLPRPHPLIEEIFYWGVAPVFTLPLPFLVAYDIPRRGNAFYQLYLTTATWIWPLYQCLFLITCGFYPGQKSYFACGSRDFVGLLYYSSALPAIALFGLGQHRLPALLPAIGILIIMAVGIVPFRHTWARSVVNFFVFQMFLLWLHFLRESADRRMYSLRDQLKIQFRATQKAQVNERKTADSKRRLTSYIFHEVRVPLNTALLAVQNMEANRIHRDQDIEFTALEGSLSMMSKVLNDVLDFNRMDSGRFESVSRPYSFHTALRSMLVPLQLAADARGLVLHTEVDKRIDEVARKALYQARGETPGWINHRLSQDQEEEGIVVGDEMRLRQIITNLTSNACKFTPGGGKISVRTRLLVPSLPELPVSEPGTPGTSSIAPLDPNSLSAHRLGQHNFTHAPLESIVVRIEIEDTGPGIRSRDLVDNKLFSPYVQTEIGRTQGGKGTGLGLALVRHIVKLSGGRLGVRSQLGVGSTFWVELRLGVGKNALLPHGSTASDSDRPSKSPQTGLGDERAGFKTDNTPAIFRRLEGEGISPASEHMSTSISSDSSSPGESDSAPLPLHAASALKTIMEQGGLVELAPRRPGGSMEQWASRSLLDFSNGTENSMSDPSVSPSGLGFSRSRDRPTYLPMPKRDPMLTMSTSSTPSIPPSPGIQLALTQTTSSPEPSLHLEHPLTALVVDDDLMTRTLMARMLTRLGVSVMCAENGAVALDMILLPDVSGTPSGSECPLPPNTVRHEHRYDIIFLDNQMPVMSGLDVVRRLREMGRTDFVVGVTGNALLSDQEEYLEAGVNRVLTKPVHERSLKSALNMAHQRKKQRSGPSSSPVWERPSLFPRRSNITLAANAALDDKTS